MTVNVDVRPTLYKVDAICVEEVMVCRKCGRSDRMNRFGLYRGQPIHDVPRGLPMELHITKQRSRCTHQNCGATAVAQPAEISTSHRMTVRLVEYIIERVARRWLLDSIVTETGVTSNEIRKLFLARFKELKEEHVVSLPEWLGVDEFNITGKAGDEDAYLILTDLQNHKVVDILKGCREEVLKDYLKKASIKNRAAVRYVGIDNHVQYRDACTALLPHAVIVSDHFHLIDNLQNCFKSAFWAVRQSMIDSINDGCKRQIDALKDSNHANRKLLQKTIRKQAEDEVRAMRGEFEKYRLILLTKKSNLKGGQSKRIARWLSRYPLLKEAYQLREGLISIWNSKITSDAADKLYARWKKSVPNELKKFYEPMLTLMNHWSEENFAFFHERVTSSYTESMIARIKNYYYFRTGCSDDLWRAVFLYPAFLEQHLGRIRSIADSRELEFLRSSREGDEMPVEALRNAQERYRKLTNRSAAAIRGRKSRSSRQATLRLTFKK